jgi:hypothetical protein
MRSNYRAERPADSYGRANPQWQLRSPNRLHLSSFQTEQTRQGPKGHPGSGHLARPTQSSQARPSPTDQAKHARCASSARATEVSLASIIRPQDPRYLYTVL